MATPPAPPHTCPKCGSEKGWHGPQFRGSVGWLAPEHLDGCTTVLTMQDGRELIDRAEALRVAWAMKQRLEYSCKTCDFATSTPTLDHDLRETPH